MLGDVVGDGMFLVFAGGATDVRTAVTGVEEDDGAVDARGRLKEGRTEEVDVRGIKGLFAGGAMEVVADTIDGGGACADGEGEGVAIAGEGDVVFVDGKGGLLGEAERLGQGLVRGGGATDDEEEEGDGGGRGEDGEEGSHDGKRGQSVLV